MIVRSLGLRTDLMIAGLEGEVLDRGTHVVVRTPTLPSYWWGNFVVFPDPPGAGDGARWRDVFAREFADVPGVRHQALTWDSVDDEAGRADELVAEGFTLDHTVYQVAEAVHRPAKWNPELTVRPIQGDAEWNAALRIHHACIPEGRDPATFGDFLDGQWRRHRRMVDAGFGQWFGAFLDGELVADMGIFVRDGLGRCQSVGTAPEHRRKGACGRLVHGACTAAFEELGAKRIVMAADATYHAAGIYRSVGFRDVERVCSLTLAGSRGA